MSKKEEGFILPIALAICTLVSFVCFMWLSQSIRAQQATRLYGEQIRVQYALESGVAQMQARLQQGGTVPTVQRIGSVFVKIRLQQRAPKEVWQVVAQGRWGVKKSVQMEFQSGHRQEGQPVRQ